MAFGDAIKREEERAYREHNVTRREVHSDGRLKREPVHAHMQCECDKCRAHRRRNAITGIASPTKDV